MSELLDIIISAVDEASEVFDRISQSAIETGESISNVDGAGLDDAASAADGLEQEVNEATEAFDELNNTAGDVMAAETLMGISSGVADSMMSMVAASGNFSDSMARATMEAEGFGISADQMKSTINEISETTGRAGGQIRESFIKATARGVTDMGSFKTMMEGAGAQATLFGTDIQTMADKFSGLAFNANLMPKALKETGITMDELATAMGMTGATADEVKAKWQELDTNQRAAILGTAASMNEGKNANEAYKHSWAGMQEQLDIAMSKLQRLVGDVLAPTVIPAIQLATGAMQALGNVISGAMSSPLGGLISLLGTLGGAFIIAVTGVGALRNILGFFRVEATLAAIQTTALAIAEEMQGGASLASAAANAIGATGFGGLAAAAWGAATAVWAVLAPLLPFIAIGAAVVGVIYLIGNAFGWWHDLGSMLDAISSGVMRLWNAFINHPDVQAAISAISGAISVLWGWIQQAGQAIMDFFGISTSGDFDIVRALIDGIGNAWNMLKQALSPVITAIQAVIGAFNQFRSGQMDLPQFIWSVLTILGQMYVTIFTRIGSFVVSIGIRLVRAGVNAARNFVTGIITRLRQLPGRVFSALIAVVSRIISAGAQWVSTVKRKALDVVNGAYNTLIGLPGKITSALSGVVDAIAKPFKKGYEDAKKWIDSIKNLKIPNPAARGGEPLEIGSNNSLSISSSDNGPIIIEDNINLTVDLKNIPAGMSADTLITALQDKNVLNALVSNRDFQSLDAQVKQKISLKKMRSGGI